MATNIATSAVIDPRAELDDDVEIGPLCVIGPQVRIGRGTRLENHVSLMGRVTLGRDNHLFPHCVIGGEPQDLSYRGSDTEVVIGDRNTIREGVTIHRATEKGDGRTLLGNDNYLMANSHVAHDCRVGNHTILANGVLLGGHVVVDDYASISGGVAVHHYATIGRYAFVSGLSRVLHDAPPYMLVDGVPTWPRCINSIALKRHQFDRAVIDALAEAHRLLFRARVGLASAQTTLRQRGCWCDEVVHLLEFVAAQQSGRHGRSREPRRAAA